MKKLLESTKNGIVEIRDMIENEQIPEECELFIFREEPGIIDDLISDLNEAIVVLS